MINDASTPSYERDIRPLFRESDRESMEFAFDLWNYHDVCKYAHDILGRLTEGSMPCDGEWPEEQIALFRRWVEAGMPV
jgi:hypothetical protein